MSDFDSVLFETSPDGLIDALIEQDERVAYFYLNGREGDFGVRACWVRNLIPGPVTFNRSEMEQGIPPVLPRMQCRHPQGADPLVAERLSVVWFEEGNGAALCEDGRLLALIPPWSGMEGFHGYARDCKAPNQVCWPLPDDAVLENRIARARDFWSSWQDARPWTVLQQRLLDAYESALGEHTGYYSIDGGKWPPKAIIRIDSDEAVFLLTVGVCIRPQPMVELVHDQARDVRRIELGIRLPKPVDGAHLDRVLRYLSGVANYPWHRQQWLGEGHTYPLDLSDELQPGKDAPRVKLTSRPSFDFHIKLPMYRDDPLNLLWMEGGS